MTHPSEPEQNEAPFKEPQQLRFLRRLVTTLTVIMVGGVLVVITLLVIRLSNAPTNSLLVLPDQITLPDGDTAQAVTFTRERIVVVTVQGDLLVLDATTGIVEKRIPID